MILGIGNPEEFIQNQLGLTVHSARLQDTALIYKTELHFYAITLTEIRKQFHSPQHEKQLQIQE